MEYSVNGNTSLFKKKTKRYSQSATPELRKFWLSLRKASKSYGLGRTELLPIRTQEEAAVKYIGKYIEKGSAFRTGPWKGVRLVSYSKSFKRAANCRFSWFESGKQWRDFVSEVAKLLKLKCPSSLRKRFGKTWGYKILTCSKSGLTPSQTVEILLKQNVSVFR